MIDVVAFMTCGASLALLTAFVSAIICANDWVCGPKTQPKKDLTVAISANKDSYDFRFQDQLPAMQPAAAIHTDLPGL